MFGRSVLHGKQRSYEWRERRKAGLSGKGEVRDSFIVEKFTATICSI